MKNVKCSNNHAPPKNRPIAKITTLKLIHRFGLGFPEKGFSPATPKGGYEKFDLNTHRRKIMEKVQCDYCGSAEYTFFCEQTDIIHKTTSELFTLVSCKGCGLTYENPRPPENEIGKYYSESYSFHSSPSLLKKVVRTVFKYLANSYWVYVCRFIPFLNKRLISKIVPDVSDPVLKYIESSGNKAISLLDIGCGSGWSANFWGEQGSIVNYSKMKNIKDVYGIEIDDYARDVLGKSGITSFRSIDDVDDNYVFDVIRMNWSLEHVHSPDKFFKFFAKHLTKNGIGIVCVPNIKGLLYILANNCVELPIHLYHFSEGDLRNYCEKHGFDVKHSFTFSYPGMFHFAGTLTNELSDFHDMNLIEAFYFQKILNKISKSKLGNDIVIIFSHKN
jgi:2-polyprenyl-3-methyl-5-hydroxy-6-metoxy-1,4-benzoquinol methylase